jgi:replication factor C small subunit
VGKKKSYNVKVPNRLFFSRKEKIARFIRAYFDGDGCYYNDRIEISSNSKELLLGIKTLLLSFGIISQVHKNRLVISGYEYVKKFSEEIGSLLNKINVLSKAGHTNKDLLPFAVEHVRFVMNTFGFEYKDIVKRKKEIEYLFRRKRGSYRKIKSIYSKIIEKSREKIVRLIELLDEIELVRGINAYQLKSDVDKLLELLKDSKIRKEVEKLTRIRYDRLLEYHQKKRRPSLISIFKILKALFFLGKIDKELYGRVSRMKFILDILRKSIKELNLSYNQICEEVNPTTLAFDIREETTSLLTIFNYLSIVENIREKILSILSNKQLINTLELLDFIVKAEIFWDRVKDVRESGNGKVCDLEVENSHNFVGGYGGIILHNTTLALVLARELYGENWRQNVLQMNASDARGIDVIRGEVKEFARTLAIGDVPFKLIILDEADAMTSDAQQALRRMMEMYANVSRFILICNYSNKIIEPIQSRCAVFRFKALDDKHVEEFVNRIVKGEKLKITEDGIKAVVRVAEGDLRKAANILQAAAALKEKITEDVVYEAASLAKPQEVKQMLELALSGKFLEAKKMLEEMIIKRGLSGSDIVSEIHRQIPSLEIDDRAKVELIEKCGEIDFRISEGANELIQLESLLASFLLYAKENKK